MQLEHKIRERVMGAIVLPEEIAFRTYTGKINKNLSNLITKYYLVNNEEYGLKTLIEIIGDLEEEDIIDLLIELGLSGINAGYNDIISLLNIIPGLPWSKKRAKEVTSYTPEQLAKLSSRSYFNTILSYVTGYYLDYNDKTNKRYNYLSETFFPSVIGIYVALNIYPYIDNDTRKLVHMYHYLSNDPESSTESYIMTAIEDGDTGVDNVIELLDMKPGNNDKRMYLFSSIKFYEEAIERPNNFAITSSFDTKFLYKLTDSELLEYIIEYPIDYTCRREIIEEATYLNSQDMWALNRQKFCKNKTEDDVIFSYGRPMKYYCFKYSDMIKEWNKNNVIKNGGFIRVDHVKGDPLKYLNRTMVTELVQFLEGLDDEEREDYQELYDNIKDIVKLAGPNTKDPMSYQKQKDPEITQPQKEPKNKQKQKEPEDVPLANVSRDVLIELYTDYLIDNMKFLNGKIRDEPEDLKYKIPNEIREAVEQGFEKFISENPKSDFGIKDRQDIDFNICQIIDRMDDKRSQNNKRIADAEIEKKKLEEEAKKKLEEEAKKKLEKIAKKKEKEKRELEETIDHIHSEIYEIDPKVTRRLPDGTIRRIPPQVLASDLKKWGIDPPTDYLGKLELYLEYITNNS